MHHLLHPSNSTITANILKIYQNLIFEHLLDNIGHSLTAKNTRKNEFEISHFYTGWPKLKYVPLITSNIKNATLYLFRLANGFQIFFWYLPLQVSQFTLFPDQIDTSNDWHELQISTHLLVHFTVGSITVEDTAFNKMIPVIKRNEDMFDCDFVINLRFLDWRKINNFAFFSPKDSKCGPKKWSLNSEIVWILKWRYFQL